MEDPEHNGHASSELSGLPPPYIYEIYIQRDEIIEREKDIHGS